MINLVPGTEKKHPSRKMGDTHNEYSSPPAALGLSHLELNLQFGINGLHKPPRSMEILKYNKVRITFFIGKRDEATNTAKLAQVPQVLIFRKI